MKKMIFSFKTKLLKKIIVTLSAVFILGFALVATSILKTSKQKTPSINHISVFDWSKDEPIASSVQAIGPNGAFSFKNLFFFKNNYLISGSENKQTFDSNKVLHKSAEYSYRFKNCPSKQIANYNTSNSSKKISGTTLIFSASKHFRRMQDHYFHFCEELIVALSALKQSEEHSSVTTIVFPNKEHWEGRYRQINAQIINSFFPNAQVINASQFKALSKKHLLKFDDVIFVDRHACHQTDVVQKYNKMVIGHHDLIKKEYIHELRDSLYKTLKTYQRPTNRPYITYVQRSTWRYLEPKFEKELLDSIAAQFPQYKLKAVKLENYTFAEQIQLFRNTKVLIGAHGNGLTHELFLPDDSLVIEIFPTGAFSMDYQYFAELSGHQYYAVTPEEGVISQVGNNMPFRGSVNQVITKFDTNWITNLIEDYSSSHKACMLNETSLDE
ncbi:MAG: hypothetical protein S4CHLAM6_06710 [Chlamydiae bacterium]|nr:hypothetical protein [Chlamydiota bacterium]